MPGLLRGVARTAVIAGTATHVSNNVSRRQANRWASKEAQQAPQQYEESAPAPQAQTDTYAELEKLGQLKNDGILTQEEFDAKKRQILGL
ncbi:MAG: SHOCT domain-containing protein [Candidatus Saccharimonadales bacterium]